MTDPVAQAAAQIEADSQGNTNTNPSILTEIVDEFKHLGEKIEHMIHPETTTPGGQSAAPSSNSQTIDASATGTVAAAASASGEPGNASASAEASATVAAINHTPGITTTIVLDPNAPPLDMTGAGIAPNAASTPPAGAATDAGIAEHPHTAILRRLTTTLRRKWNVFDGELELILKDAESHF
jgi:hypothetical protein